jgi:hypothetical protein
MNKDLEHLHAQQSPMFDELSAKLGVSCSDDERR